MALRLLKQLYSGYQKFKISKSPQMNLVWGFFLYTLTGFVLLSIPLCHRQSISVLDNLFIATSAISTTGLVTVSIYDSYNLYGQIIIMALFQIGGIGYMTLTTYYLLFTTNRITRWHNELMGAEFSLPKTIKISDFIRSVVIFTIIMEILGAVAFYIGFTQSGMSSGEAVWSSIFHSVSAFCTAGFSLFNDGFVGYSDHVLINMTIAVLAIAGSLGFIVITDIWYRLRQKTNELSFTTKIIIYGFILLLTLGTALIYSLESTVHGTEDAFMKSFFQAMSAMTTVGFNTIPTGELSLAVLLFITFLMYLGASPSGTAGGLKITTLTVVCSDFYIHYVYQYHFYLLFFHVANGGF